MRQIVVVAEAQFRALGVVLTILNVVRARGRTGRRIGIGRDAKTTAALPFAETLEVAAKSLDIELGPLRENLLVFERPEIALEPETIEKARRDIAIDLVERRSRRRHLGQAARFAMFFVVEIERSG